MALVPRIHLDVPLEPGALIALDSERSHYLMRVLRMRPGASLQVTDGRGVRADATLVDGTASGARIRIETRGVDGGDGRSRESPLRITLAQCVSGADKMDWTIEKACELGVAAIVPLLSRRSLVRLDAQRGQRKAQHWQRVVTAACLQCGRDVFPAIDEATPLSDWLAGLAAAPTATRLVLAPGATRRLRDLAPPSGPVVVLVGPEAGFDDRELDDATAAGLLPVALGPRVLRTETAGLAALAALQSLFGDF